METNNTEKKRARKGDIQRTVSKTRIPKPKCLRSSIQGCMKQPLKRLGSLIHSRHRRFEGHGSQTLQNIIKYREKIDTALNVNPLNGLTVSAPMEGSFKPCS